jgi:hypothetical protein
VSAVNCGAVSLSIYSKFGIIIVLPPFLFIYAQQYNFTTNKRQIKMVGGCWTPNVSRGRSDPEAGRSAVRTVRGSGADGPRVRRIS